jgi:hypothetical protein
VCAAQVAAFLIARNQTARLHVTGTATTEEAQTDQLDEAGRTLSAATRKRINEHLEYVRTAMVKMQELLDSVDAAQAGDATDTTEATESLRVQTQDIARALTGSLTDLLESFSFDDRRRMVCDALQAKAGTNNYVWVRDLYDDKVVYTVEPRNGPSTMDSAGYQQAPYTVDANGKVTVGDSVKVKQVTDYVVVESAGTPAPAEGAADDPTASGSEAAPTTEVAEATKTEGGSAFKASDYAYVPDASKPSTWKLRLTTTPGGDPDAGIVGAAIAALGEGFRGNKVQIPSDALASVKSKVRSAWRKANPDKSADDMPDAIKESGEVVDIHGDLVMLNEAAIKRDGSTRLKLIAPGWGSSGYYSADVLKRDGPEVFTEGLKTYIDHPTKEDDKARPERSLKDLAGVLTSTAEWDESGPDGPGLYANAKIFSTHRETLSEMAPHIGVSIRALGRANVGEIAGRKGPIIESISIARSADYVTAAGAGGKIANLEESARVATEQTIVKEGTTMPDIEVEEARREAASARAEASAATTALTEVKSQLTAAQTTIAEWKPIVESTNRLRERLLLREAADLARIHLKTSDLPQVTIDRLVKEASSNPPITAEGAIDEVKFTESLQALVATETAYIAQITESGKVKGMGGPAPTTDVETARASASSAMQRLGLTESGAKLAVSGR